MAIKFFNVKTRERKSVDTEPAVSAYYNSSNLGPNARVQDMGWRLDPEVVVRIKKIKQDESLMTRIAANAQIPRENLTDTDVLFYVSEEDRRENQQQVAEEDHTDEYEQEIRDLEKGDKDLDPKKIGETASEEAERVSLDERSDIEKASGSVADSDDDSVNLSQGTIKAHDKANKDAKKAGVTSNEHEEGSVRDGTAKLEADDDSTLDEIIEGAQEEGQENAEEDAATHVAPEDETTTEEAIEEGQDTAAENTDGDDTELSEAYSRSRKELNKLAADRGVKDPESYQNKDTLAEAIKNVHTEQ